MLLRQVRVRPVPRVFRLRLPVVIGVIGLFELIGYAGNHHVAGSAWALGARHPAGRRRRASASLRGLTVRVWTAENWVLRQGTASRWRSGCSRSLVHFAGDACGAHAGAAGLEGASFLLYLGVTLGVQYYVVHRRALPLWAQLGPMPAGRSRCNFTQGPGAFFATFRHRRAARRGRPAGATQPGGAGATTIRNVIDAEVVEDDDGPRPPELPRAPLIVPYTRRP